MAVHNRDVCIHFRYLQNNMKEGFIFPEFPPIFRFCILRSIPVTEFDERGGVVWMERVTGTNFPLCGFACCCRGAWMESIRDELFPGSENHRGRRAPPPPSGALLGTHYNKNQRAEKKYTSDIFLSTWHIYRIRKVSWTGKIAGESGHTNLSLPPRSGEGGEREARPVPLRFIFRHPFWSTFPRKI